MLAVILASVAFIVGGEPEQVKKVGTEIAQFMTVGAEIAPLAILAALAYGGARNTVAAGFAYIWLAIIAFGVLLYALVSVLLAEIRDFGLFRIIRDDPTVLSSGAVALRDVFKPDTGQALLWTILLLIVASVLAMATLLRPVRVQLSRLMPIDPDNFVHKIALCTLTLITLSLFAPLIALGGEPPILEVVKNISSQDLQGAADLGVRPADQIYLFVWTIPAALVAAGWPIARRFRAALLRLGMVRPTSRQVLAGLAFGVVLAGLAAMLDLGIHWLWTALGWPTTDTSAFNKILAQLITPAGALLVGVTAGVGEEMVFRGLLQPRFGLIAANLVFTSLHAAQYGLDGLVSVFIVGSVLGIIRARSNTTTSAIVHGVYDFTLILAASLAGP